jgi:hypothetical protein
VVWGGQGATDYTDGAIYSLASNTWSNMNNTGAPNGYTGKTTFSNGYFVCASYANASKYSIAGGNWTTMPATNRALHGIAANATCIFTYGGQTSMNAGAAAVLKGERFFWTAQSVTAHNAAVQQLFLYKKN